MTTYEKEILRGLLRQYETEIKQLVLITNNLKSIIEQDDNGDANLDFFSRGERSADSDVAVDVVQGGVEEEQREEAHSASAPFPRCRKTGI